MKPEEGFENCPIAQSWHSTALAPLLFPAAQKLQTGAPEPEYFPTTQGEHVVEPSVSEYCPGEQTTQVVAPAPLIFPEPQFKQDGAPTSFITSPG